MKNELSHWSKKELKVYILLLCAKVDDHESEDEIDFIKSKTSEKIFKRIYKEFSADDEDTCFEKIEYNIGRKKYSPKELNELKKEIMQVFASDNKFQMKERYLEQVLDNILY